VILLLLAVIWGVFLVPQLLRARADRGPADSIGSFRNQLSMIERSLPEGQTRGQARRSFPSAAASSAMPAFGAPVYGAPVAARGIAPSRSELQRRRRDVLLALLAAVIATLALGLVFKPAFALNFVADAAFATYVALLVRARTIAAEREMKVRYLPGPVPAYAADSSPLRSIAR
jgi:type II secretory pathway component PulM